MTLKPMSNDVRSSFLGPKTGHGIFSDCRVTARGSVEGKSLLTLEPRSVTSFSFCVRCED